jgi:hypothetical protein
MTEAEAKQRPEYNILMSSIEKAPHELTENDLIRWSWVERAREDYLMHGRKVPEHLESAWNILPEPLGAYRWFFSELPLKDMALARLESVSVADVLPDPQRQFDLEWDVAATYRRTQLVRREYELFGRIFPLTAYRDKSGHLISRDGTYRLMVAKELGITQMSCWVISTKDSYAMNRSRYAQEQGADNTVLKDLEKAVDGPLLCPDYTPKELASLFQSKTGDKLDAIFKAIEGDLEPLKKLAQEDKAWVSKFMK